jgi:hypothetical protein
MKSIKGIVVYTLIVVGISLVYYVYAYQVYSPVAERETFLSELGEGFGEAGLWLLSFIYARTVLKILLGKGAIARRLLPAYSPPVEMSVLNQLLGLLNRTHVYVGIAAIAVILLHIGMMGIPMNILFFPAVLLLVVWQGVFGFFLTWRFTPKELGKFSYLVHAQFITGIMIAVFAFFGHMLIED